MNWQKWRYLIAIVVILIVGGLIVLAISQRNQPNAQLGEGGWLIWLVAAILGVGVIISVLNDGVSLLGGLFNRDSTAPSEPHDAALDQVTNVRSKLKMRGDAKIRRTLNVGSEIDIDTRNED